MFVSPYTIALTMQVQDLEDVLQNVNLQMSRIQSDLQVTQQEKEALKQEVMSLRRQLQNAGDKVISSSFFVIMLEIILVYDLIGFAYMYHDVFCFLHKGMFLCVFIATTRSKQ